MRSLLGLTFLLLAALPVLSQNQAPAPLVISFVPIPPFAQFGPNGERTGFLVELAELISTEIGVPIEYLDVPDTEAFVQSQISGETQMIAGVAKIPPLRGANLFSNAVATESLRPIVLETRAAEFEGAEITGRRIGIVPPALGSQETELLAKNDPVIFESPEAAVMGLLLGNIDVLLAPEPVVYSIARRAGADGRIHFVGEPLREVERLVALHESRAALLGPINSAIARLEADGRLGALRQRFNITSPPPPPDVLTVGVTDFPPYQSFGEDGAPTGFAVDVLRDLASQGGLNLRFKPLTREEWKSGPQPGRYDMLPQTSVSDAQRTRMDFTLPIERARTSVFARLETLGEFTGPDDIAGRKVGVHAASRAHLIAKDQIGVDLAVMNDRDDLITDLAEGRLDAVLFSEEVFLQLLKDRGLEGEIAPLDEPFNVNQRAPALRFGLAAVRDQLDAVIPGYLLSDAYHDLQRKYFGAPVYWTRARINAALAVAGAAFLLVILTAAGVTLRNRANASASVAAARDELETIFDATNSGIVAFDAAGKIVRVNNRARHLLGGVSDPTPFEWPSPIKFLDAETMQPLDASADPVRRAMSGHALRGETHLMRRLHAVEDHRYVRLNHTPAGNRGSAIQLVIAIDDVSNEERNRQVVERKSRLDALGQLTGGIAHDFNNLLASQLYAVDLARNAASAEKRDSYLEIAADAVQRGRSLTSRLLAFARRQPGLSTVGKTSVLFADFEKLVRPMLEAQIEITLTVEDPDLHHFCDQTQLETALMNLVLNARDAILRSGKGSRIDIRARPVRATHKGLDAKQSTGGAGPDDPSDDIAMPASTFRYVEISVIDNGPGMDEETLSRCTDPFFTTKESNSGTGLGLAMVYGFIRQSDGDFRIYSEETLGTTVQMTLPRGAVTGQREQAMPEDNVIRGGGQTILIAEDNLQLLMMITEIVEDLGYRVESARSGLEALSYVESGEHFDLLLTDVVMPGEVGGFGLARRVRAIRPDIPVIYTSGYTGFTATEMGDVQAPLLQKPAAPAKLAEAIAQGLAGTA